MKHQTYAIWYHRQTAHHRCSDKIRYYKRLRLSYQILRFNTRARYTDRANISWQGPKDEIRSLQNGESSELGPVAACSLESAVSAVDIPKYFRGIPVPCVSVQRVRNTTITVRHAAPVTAYLIPRRLSAVPAVPSARVRAGCTARMAVWPTASAPAAGRDLV